MENDELMARGWRSRAPPADEASRGLAMRQDLPLFRGTRSTGQGPPTAESRGSSVFGDRVLMWWRVGLVVVVMFLVDSGVGRLQADQSTSESTSQTQSAVRGSGLVELLEKAIPSVENYTLQLTNIVAEEKYEQRSWTGSDNLRNQEATPEPRGYRIGTRTLLSDFLTVWVPASSSWIEFRDVYEVDGKPVRERQARLESLFVAPAADAQDRARAIMDESARYNLGSIGRNFNMPTFALRVLHLSHVARFHFKSNGDETIDGIRTCKIDFEEIRGPTLVTNVETATDLFSTGSLWLDCATGRVVQTLFMVASPKLNIRARITVLFREDSRLGIWVPSRMMELYDRPYSPGSYHVECRADYTNFRKFEVTAKENWEPGPHQ